MAAPSKNFIPIIDEQINPNSPVDELLITSIRDSLVHLEEWLGDSFTAAKDHKHDGVDSAKINQGDLIVADKINFFDDFILDLGGYTILNSNAALVDTANGVVRITQAASSSANGFRSVQKVIQLDSAETLIWECRIKFNTAVPAWIQIGLTDNPPATSPGNGIWFDRVIASADEWECRSRASSVETSTSTGVAQSTSFQVLRMEATTNQVKFFIDGNLVATHVTNIPTALLFIVFSEQDTATPNSSHDIDFVHIVQARI